jgi:O-antigen/teichoic acid export membrane protein
VRPVHTASSVFPALRGEGRRSLRLLLGNIAAIGASRVGGILIDGLTYVLVARYFGPAEYGHYLALLAFLNLIDLAADMTVLDIAVREISKNPAQTGTWLATGTVLRLLLAGLGLLAYIPYIYLARIVQTSGMLATAWIASLILPVGALRMPLAVFRAKMKMHFELAVILITRLVNLALFLTLMHYHLHLYQFFLATLFSRLLLAVLVWGAALGWLHVRLSFRMDIFRTFVRESFPMGVSGLLVALQLKMDILMVAIICGAVAAGLYGAVAQLPEYSLLIPTIITTPLLPVLSSSSGEGLRGRFQRVYQNMVDAVITIVAPLVVLALVMPRETVSFLFGARFIDAAPVLPFLVLSVLFMWFSHALAIACVAAGLQKSFIWIQSICLSVYLVLNSLLIPSWGLRGAGFARLVANIIAPLLTYYVVKNRTGCAINKSTFRRTILASLAMAVALTFASRYPLLLAGSIGVLAYGATLYAIRPASRLEMEKGAAS